MRKFVSWRRRLINALTVAVVCLPVFAGSRFELQSKRYSIESTSLLKPLALSTPEAHNVRMLQNPFRTSLEPKKVETVHEHGDFCYY